MPTAIAPLMTALTCFVYEALLYGLLALKAKMSLAVGGKVIKDRTGEAKYRTQK